MEQDLINKYKNEMITPTLDAVMAELDFSSNFSYPKLRDYLVAQKVCTAREYNRMRHGSYVKAVLGTVPDSAAELVDVIVGNCGVETGGAGGFSLWWTCPMTGTRQPCDEVKLVQQAHQINDSILGNRIREATILRAVRFWIDAHRAIDRQRRIENLCLPASFDWAAFGEVFFEDSRVRREVQVAAFQKFIWQVKRRMTGLAITNHLMVVIYGVQGKGKSKAIEGITAPLGHLVATGDFQRLGDIREVALFESFVVILDEMQKASHADVDRVKNVVTRDHFSYRPMHSNANVSSVQNATFVGTSNRSLDQMILDPTGNRRFFQIDWARDAGPEHWAFFNSLDIEDMWRSVDHLADDPTLPFMEEIRAIQGKAAYRNTVGQFFDAVVEGLGTCTVRDGADTVKHEFAAVFCKEDFYLVYRRYCDHTRIKNPLEQEGFIKEVRRIADQESDCPFRLVRTRMFNGWKYAGPKPSEFIEIPILDEPLFKRLAA